MVETIFSQEQNYHAQMQKKSLTKKHNTKYNDLQFKSKLISELCKDIGINTDENLFKNQWIPYIYINKL